LTFKVEEIVEYLNSLDKESKAIKKDLLKMCWYMRGGLTYEEAFNLSIQERGIVNEIIADNLETTKKSKMPFF
jgi:glutamate formiminotransferase